MGSEVARKLDTNPSALQPARVKTRIILLLAALSFCVSMSGCIAAAAAAGGAAGYHAHKEGYRLQSPVTKD